MLFLIILLVSFLVRISRFDFPASYTFAWGDGTRDFLVASHILKYHELPLNGPYNLLYDVGVHNSPIYFYIISLPLALFNNILTLSLVNIFIQLGVIILIYLIAKLKLNYTAAIAAVLLFSFNPEVIKQADFVWQPYLMLPLALLALYLKLKGRHLLGLAILCLASLIHSSAYPWVPLFFFLPKNNARYYIYGAGLILVFLLLNGFAGLHLNLPIQPNFPTDYFSNFNANVVELLKAFYLNNILAIFLAAGFLVTLKKSQDKRLLVFLFLLFIFPIILASSFNKIRLHYLILSMPVLPILAAKTTEIFKGAMKWIIVIALLIVFSGGFQYFKEAKLPLENQKGINNLTLQVVGELSKIKQSGGFSDFDFFQVVSFTRVDPNTDKIIPYPVLDSFLLVGLEEKLNKKLASVSDKSPYNHIQINKKNYLLVSCFKTTEDDPLCLNYFKTTVRDFNILKRVYNNQSISIYLAKHVQN